MQVIILWKKKGGRDIDKHKDESVALIDQLSE